MTAVTARTPSNAQHLPATAASFFSHYSTTSKAKKLALSLHRTLNAQATQHSFDASLSRARTEKAASRTQDGLRLFAQTTRRLAHLRSISAPMASMWKQAVPSTASLTLLDSQYRLAARLNLDLAPLRNMAPLPEQCPTCEQPGVFSDTWHCLITRRTRRKTKEKRRQMKACTRPRRRTTAERRRAVRTRTSKAHIQGSAWALSQRRVGAEGSLSD